MFRASWRSLVQHKLRLVLSVLAIMLSVGFVVGTLIFTDTLNKTFTDLFGQTTTDVVVTPKTDFEGLGLAGEVPTLDPGLLDEIAQVPGAAKAGGAVFADGVAIIGADDEPLGQPGAPQFGSNWSDDEELTPYRLVDGTGPSTANEVAIDSVSAEDGQLEVGDTIRLVAPTGEVEAELVGVFRFGTSGNLAGATIAAFDTETAQNVLLDGGQGFTEIDVVAAEGVTQQQLADEVTAVADPDVTVQTGEEAADQAASDITEALSFFNVILLVFALIALFVGSFLILNTFSMLISQRTRELALLRAVGATRGQVTRSILAESLAVGAVSSVLGCAMGIGVVYLLRWFFGTFGLDLGSTPLQLEPRTFAIGIFLGVAFTAVAAWFPARRASKIPPVAALRDDATLPAKALTLRALLGGVQMLAGAGVLVAGVASGGSSGASLVGLGVLLLLTGTITFSPVLATPVARGLGYPLPRLFGTVGRLAVDNASRQPRRSAATASALMIGLALVTALTIFASSITASLNAAIDRVIGAEFIVATDAQRPFPRSVANEIEGLPDVSVVSRTTFTEAQLAADSIPAPTGAEEPPTTFVGTVDPSTVADVINLTFSAGDLNDLTDDGVIVDTTTASNSDLEIGDEVEFTFASGSAQFELVGLYEPAGFFTGYAITNQALEDAGVRIGDTFGYVRAADDADLDALKASIEGVLTSYPGVIVQSQAELKEQVQSNVQTLLSVMIALLGLAIVIAILGIVNTLFLSVLERTREIGMLRAVGTSRWQVRWMVVLESVVIAVFGAILGVVLGVIFAGALQRTLADQGIDVLAIPWPVLVLYLVIAMSVGALAAAWPARRAARLDVLTAITSE
ncbi:MAG: ABC transporter permease [Actinomycetia bacterium]|nr:ABC transporter permease [Actinomycetes bacterium]